MPTGYDIQNHIVAVRMRLQGSGTFYSTLNALEDSPTQNLADVTLQAAPNRPVNLLANIRGERIQFYGRTTAIDEYFTLKNLTFYVKQIATGYPQ